MSAKAQSIKLKETENQEALLAQWQTCVEMANAVSERRDTMNNLFVTLPCPAIFGIHRKSVLTVGMWWCA